MSMGPLGGGGNSLFSSNGSDLSAAVAAQAPPALAPALPMRVIGPSRPIGTSRVIHSMGNGDSFVGSAPIGGGLSAYSPSSFGPSPLSSCRPGSYLLGTSSSHGSRLDSSPPHL